MSKDLSLWGKYNMVYNVTLDAIIESKFVEVKIMNNKSNKKKEAWRIIMGIISIAYIVFLWVKNDIVNLYITMSKEAIIPLVATTISVSLLKVFAIIGTVLFIKWIIKKISNKTK